MLKDAIILPKIELRHLTVAALATGSGAALGYALIPWYCGFFLLILLLLLTGRDRIRFICWFLVALAAGIIHLIADTGNAGAVPRKAALLEAEMVCTDRRTTCVNTLPAPAILNCEIIRNGKSFTAACILPKDAPPAVYGERFRFRGRFYPATPAGMRFTGDGTVEYLPPLYGKRPLIVAEKLTPLPGKSTFFGFFFRCRDFLLRRLLAKVTDPAVRTMAAKTFFSASTGAPPELMDKFVTTGTVHLFSVSGLHVSVLAGLLLLLFRAVPFIWRYRMTAAVIPFYVLCTGASVPSIRAGAMLTLWCILRSMLFYAPGWNSMMAVWCFFAIFSPGTLAELGPQYSFCITGALLLLIDKIKFHRQREAAILDLMPPHAKLTLQTKRKIRRKYRLITFFAVAVTAFAASSGLSLLRQNLFVPGSIAANLLLPFFTPLLFAAMVFKLLCGALLPAFDFAGAWLLTAGFRGLSFTVGAIAEIYPRLPVLPPPVWVVVVFYLLLFTALNSRSAKTTFICAGGTAAMLLLAPLSHCAAPGKFMVISRGAESPALLAYLPPGSPTAYIVDVPDTAVAALAVRQLHANGIRSAVTGFSRGVRSHNSGMKQLARNLDCTILMPPDRRKPSAAFLRTLDDLQLRRDNAAVLYLTAPDNTSLIWQLHDGTTVAVSQNDSGRNITVTPRNSPPHQVTLPWSSIPVLWEIQL